MLRVLAFTVKPRESADSRYRILQYVAVAERDDICIDHRSFMGSRYFPWQIRNQQLLLRLLLYPALLSIRLWQVLFLAPQYDSVWISREMARSVLPCWSNCWFGDANASSSMSTRTAHP